jgi:Na+-transporting NADH:ubiquinone oxidoreductase subunit F
MNLYPILAMNLILLVITVLLIVADRLLVTYGKCKISVSEGEQKKEFEVQGGGALLGYLSGHGVGISSSCGGRGTCGYCKVRVASGGGQILPTEELFMSRQEKAEGMRLACQLKVKGDLSIVIPDYLTVVRQMAVNRKFDPNKRWKVTIY